jgi:hypothetical protein
MAYVNDLTVAATSLASSELFANKAIASAAQVIVAAWNAGYVAYDEAMDALTDLKNAATIIKADLVSTYNPDISGLSFTPSTITVPTRPTPGTAGTTPTAPSGTLLTQEQWNAIYAPRLADAQRVPSGEYMARLKQAAGLGFGTHTAAIAKVLAETTAQQAEAVARLAGEQAAQQAVATREDLRWLEELKVKIWETEAKINESLEALANSQWAAGAQIYNTQVQRDRVNLDWLTAQLNSIMEIEKTRAAMELDAASKIGAVDMDLAKTQVNTLAAIHGSLIQLVDVGLTGSGSQDVNG